MPGLSHQEQGSNSIEQAEALLEAEGMLPGATADKREDGSDGTSSIPSNKYLAGSATSRTVHAHTTAADVDPDRAQKLRDSATKETKRADPMARMRHRRGSVQEATMSLQFASRVSAKSRTVSKAAQRAKTTVKEKKQNQHENDLNTRQGLHKLMRKSFNMMAIAAVVGLVTMVLNLEVLTRQFIHSGSQTYEATVAIKVIKCIMSISVVFQAAMFIRYSVFRKQYMTMLEGENYMRNHRLKHSLCYVLELLLACIHIPPFIHYSWRQPNWDNKLVIYHIDMVNLVMLTRLYLLPRLVLYNSDLWCKSLFTFTAALNDVPVTASMAMKMAYARHPVRVTMLTCLVPLLACSFMFSVCERLADPVFADMNRAVYHTFLSFAGEVSHDATTECARSALLIQVTLGYIGSALLLSLIFSAMVMSAEQQTLVRTVTEQENVKGLRHAAARTLQHCWRLHQKLRRDATNSRRGKKMDVAQFKRYIWSIIHDWKRVKHGQVFQEDFQTSVQVTQRLVLEKVDHIAKGTVALRESLINDGEENGQEGPPPSPDYSAAVAHGTPSNQVGQLRGLEAKVEQLEQQMTSNHAEIKGELARLGQNLESVLAALSRR